MFSSDLVRQPWMLQAQLLNYITPKVIKNKLRAFTNWIYDYVGPSNIDAVLNDTKDYIQSTYHGLKEFNFDNDNVSLVGNLFLKK